MLVDVWLKNEGSEKIYLFMDKARKFRRMGTQKESKK
jgi:hypothetical protein